MPTFESAQIRPHKDDGESSCVLGPVTTEGSLEELCDEKRAVDIFRFAGTAKVYQEDLPGSEVLYARFYANRIWGAVSAYFRFIPLPPVQPLGKSPRLRHRLPLVENLRGHFQSPRQPVLRYQRWLTEVPGVNQLTFPQREFRSTTPLGAGIIGLGTTDRSLTELSEPR